MSDCVGDALAEVDLEGGQRGVPVVGAAPLGLGAGDREVDQLAGGVFGWEVPAGLDDLAVECLDRVGCVDRAADVGREGQEGDDPFPVLEPAAADRRVPVVPLLGEALELVGGAASTSIAV